MARAKVSPYPKDVLDLMEEKTAVLMKAHTFAEMGMSEIAAPLFASAATQEEQVAPLLEVSGHDLEAAVHRISAASCWEKAGDLARAANLYRAALGGPLLNHTRRDVEKMLAGCLARLSRSPGGDGRGRPARRAPTKA